jgi:hypothetical protein
VKAKEKMDPMKNKIGTLLDVLTLHLIGKLIESIVPRLAPNIYDEK